jgi:hypothetical protein
MEICDSTKGSVDCDPLRQRFGPKKMNDHSRVRDPSMMAMRERSIDGHDGTSGPSKFDAWHMDPCGKDPWTNTKEPSVMDDGASAEIGN